MILQMLNTSEKIIILALIGLGVIKWATSVVQFMTIVTWIFWEEEGRVNK